MEISRIDTSKAPKAIGPYSQGIRAGEFLFISGQIPIDPNTGEILSENIRDATRRVIENIVAILEAAGGSLKNVVKVNVYIKNMENFQDVNEIYESYFGDHKPARAFVEVSDLPKNVEIEMEAIAYMG